MISVKDFFRKVSSIVLKLILLFAVFFAGASFQAYMLINDDESYQLVTDAREAMKAFKK